MQQNTAQAHEQIHRARQEAVAAAAQAASVSASHQLVLIDRDRQETELASLHRQMEELKRRLEAARSEPPSPSARKEPMPSPGPELGDRTDTPAILGRLERLRRNTSPVVVA